MMVAPSAFQTICRNAGNPGCGMNLNVADQDSVTTVVKAISDQFGAPLVLVNNAGITRDNILHADEAGGME